MDLKKIGLDLDPKTLLKFRDIIECGELLDLKSKPVSKDAKAELFRRLVERVWSDNEEEILKSIQSKHKENCLPEEEESMKTRIKELQMQKLEELSRKYPSISRMKIIREMQKLENT